MEHERDVFEEHSGRYFQYNESEIKMEALKSLNGIILS